MSDIEREGRGGPPRRDEASSTPPDWQFPRELEGTAGDGTDDGDAGEWTELCSLPAGEADALANRLLDAGIPAHLETDEHAADDDANFNARPTRVTVQEEHVDVAREILERPDEYDAEIAAERAADVAAWKKRAAEDWICPRCDKRSLVALPLSAGWRKVRLGCFGVLALPLVGAVVAWTVPLKSVERVVYDPPQLVATAWVVTVLVLSALVVTARTKRRRCTECDWSTDDAESDPDQDDR